MVLIFSFQFIIVIITIWIDKLTKVMKKSVYDVYSKKSGKKKKNETSRKF